MNIEDCPFDPDPPSELITSTIEIKKTKTKKVKAEVIKPEPILGIVLYSDGSCNPNPGTGGWGVHGYLFDYAVPTKGTGNSDIVLTATGYVPKPEKTIEDEIIPVEKVNEPEPKIIAVSPIHYFDGFGSFMYDITNNIAELVAATEAFKVAAKFNVVSALFLIDSKYVLEGIKYSAKWIRNDWKLSTGNPVKNIPEWKALLEAYQVLIDKKITLQLNWVEGHSGNFGNEAADRLAAIGTRHSVSKVFKNDMVVSDAQGYWKYTTNKHPFINHSRMYFNSTIEYSTPGEYYFGVHGKDDNMAGKRQPDGCYSLIRLKEPDKVLEEIRNYTCSIANGLNSIMLVRLDYVYKPEMHEQLSKWGGLTLIKEAEERLDLFNFKDKEPLAKEVNPPLLIQRTVDAIVEMGEKLQEFQTNSTGVVITDLTGLIYDIEITNKKEVEVKTFKLKPQFKVGVSELIADINYKHFDGSVDVCNLKLMLGMDLLGRNGLKQLEETNPKVSLITWFEDPAAFRYATVIQSGEDVGIWESYYSNLRLILPKKS